MVKKLSDQRGKGCKRCSMCGAMAKGNRSKSCHACGCVTFVKCQVVAAVAVEAVAHVEPWAAAPPSTDDADFEALMESWTTTPTTAVAAATAVASTTADTAATAERVTEMDDADFEAWMVSLQSYGATTVAPTVVNSGFQI
jgi:predicted alpha/beta hydrolase family esterase